MAMYAEASNATLQKDYRYQSPENRSGGVTVTQSKPEPAVHKPELTEVIRRLEDQLKK